MEIVAFPDGSVRYPLRLVGVSGAEKTKQNVPMLRTQTNVVLVPALVKDQAGKLVFGLQAKDFIIEDDGVQQQVSMDETEPQEAVALVIAIQTGRSALLNFSA